KTLTTDKATELNFVETKGVLVTKVIEGSAAQNIGLNPNDVIVNFNNTPIKNYNDLITQINQQKPNNQVEITYLSNGAQVTKTAILGESQSQNFNYNYEYKINENGTTKPFLGITQMSNNQQQNEIIVSKVLPNTTAQEMGILPNDIITQFNQQTVESFEHLAQLIKNQQVGDSITVQLKRNNQT